MSDARRAALSSAR